MLLNKYLNESCLKVWLLILNLNEKLVELNESIDAIVDWDLT